MSRFLGVAVVLLRHTSNRLILLTTHPQSHESCEVVLMWVTSQHRFRSTLFCRCLRDATLWRPINAFDEYFMELKARSCRFKCSAQRVCVSWFGNVTFFDVAVVLTHHNLSSPTPQYDESCEVVLMCVPSQTSVCNDLFGRILCDA